MLVVKTSHESVSLLRDLPLLLATRPACPHAVVQFHGGRSDRLANRGWWLFKAASRLLFALTDGVLVLSSQEARYAGDFHPGGTFRMVVNPYVPPQEGTSPSAGSALKADMPPGSEPIRLPSGKRSKSIPTLLFAGRLIVEKGVLDTMTAFAMVRAKRPCRLVVAGTGPLSRDLPRLAEDLGVIADVTFAGQLTGSELLAMYRSADIFVLPTYWPEGFPTAITEAMSAGLPVLTTKLRGMADHLREGEHALFVSPQAPTELAEAIQRLLDDDALRVRMGKANRAKVQDFAPPAAARQYLDALNDIAGFAKAT